MEKAGAALCLSWLTGTPARFPGAPGEWAADDSGVTVDLAPGEELVLDGARIAGRHHFGRIPERGGLFPSDAAGVYEVAKRGGNDILRPRHPDAPLRAGFRGTPAYAPGPRLVGAPPGRLESRSPGRADHPAVINRAAPGRLRRPRYGTACGTAPAV